MGPLRVLTGYDDFLASYEQNKKLLDSTKDAGIIIGDHDIRFEAIKDAYTDPDYNIEQQLHVYKTELTADLIADLLGNDYFINKLAERDASVLTKILSKLKSLTQKSADLDKASVRYLNRLASKFAKAIDNRRGGVKLSDLGGDEEEETENDTESIDFEDDLRYNKRVRFLHQNFPSERETGSEAHRLAVWWARRADVEAGDQTLISMKGNWYLVEKFDDAENNYQIEALVSRVELEAIFKEIKENGRSGKIKSIQGTFAEYDKRNKSSSTSESGKPSADSFETQHRGKNKKMVRVAEAKNQGTGIFGSDGNGDSEGGGENQQGYNSITDDNRYSKSKKTSSSEPKLVMSEDGNGLKLDYDPLAELHGEDAEDTRFPNVWKSQQRSIIADEPKLRKRISDEGKLKKYTKKEAKLALNEILRSFGAYDIKLKGRTKAQLEDMLWDALNSAEPNKRMGKALDVADYIIKSAFAIEYVEPSGDVQYALTIVDALKPYLHNMNLTYVKGDIKAKYDEDNSPYALWAKSKDKKGKGYTADEVAQELQALGIRVDSTSEADIFLEIDRMYREARQLIEESAPQEHVLLGVLDSKEAKALKQRMAKDILLAYDEYGQETSLSRLQKKYESQIRVLNRKLSDAHALNTLENRILKEVKKIKDSKSGKYANATQTQSKIALFFFISLFSRFCLSRSNFSLYLSNT